jgi:hypothetical protein
MPIVSDGISELYYKEDLKEKYVPESSVAKSAYGKTGCIWSINLTEN